MLSPPPFQNPACSWYDMLLVQTQNVGGMGFPPPPLPHPAIHGVRLFLFFIVGHKYLIVLFTEGPLLEIPVYMYLFSFVYHSLIKLSSPNLNYLIGVGAIILYLDIYLQVIPTTDPYVVEVLCHLIPWPTAIGYSLCYGTIVVKMIRVHLIFTNPKPKSKNVRERKLEYIEVHIYPISYRI